MRSAVLLCMLLAACGGSDVLPSATASTVPTNPVASNSVQAEFTQYRNAAAPLTKLMPEQCAFGGAVLTASANTIYVGGMRKVALADWSLAIVPRGGSARLVAFDRGPTNIEVLSEYGGDQHSPISTGGQVSAQINRLIDSGAQSKQIGLVICGSAEVYLSTVNMVWSQ